MVSALLGSRSAPTDTRCPFPSSSVCFTSPPRLELSHRIKLGSLGLPFLPHSAVRCCPARRGALPGERRRRRRRRDGAWCAGPADRLPAQLRPTSAPRASASWPGRLLGPLAPAAPRGRILPLPLFRTKRGILFQLSPELMSVLNNYTPFLPAW